MNTNQTAPQTFALPQILKNLTFSIQTMEAHKANVDDQDGIVLLVKKAKDLRMEMAMFLNHESRAKAEAARAHHINSAEDSVEQAMKEKDMDLIQGIPPSFEYGGRTIANREAALSAMQDIFVSAKKAKNSLKLSKTHASIEKWTNKIISLRSDYRMVKAYADNPNTPSLTL